MPFNTDLKILNFRVKYVDALPPIHITKLLPMADLPKVADLNRPPFQYWVKIIFSDQPSFFMIQPTWLQAEKIGWSTETLWTHFMNWKCTLSPAQLFGHQGPREVISFFQLLRSPACSDNYMRAQPTCHAGYQWFRLEAPQEIPRIIVRSQIFRHKEEDYDVLMRIRDQNPRTIPPFFSLIIFQKNCRDLKLRSNQKFVKRIHRHRFIWFSKYNTIFSCDEQLMKWGCHSVCSFVRSAPTKEFFLSLKSFNGVSRKFKGCLKFEGCFKEV